MFVVGFIVGEELLAVIAGGPIDGVALIALEVGIDDTDVHAIVGVGL